MPTSQKMMDRPPSQVDLPKSCIKTGSHRLNNNTRFPWTHHKNLSVWLCSCYSCCSNPDVATCVAPHNCDYCFAARRRFLGSWSRRDFFDANFVPARVKANVAGVITEDGTSSRQCKSAQDCDTSQTFSWIMLSRTSKWGGHENQHQQLLKLPVLIFSNPMKLFASSSFRLRQLKNVLSESKSII